jgi:hypothetical protein
MFDLFIIQRAYALGLVDPGNVDNLGVFIGRIISYILLFAAALVVLFIIWSGLIYITSTGNKDRVERAKKTLTYAILGLIILLGLYFFIPIIVAVLDEIF